MTIAENPRIKSIHPARMSNSSSDCKFCVLKNVTYKHFLTLLYTLYYEEFSICYQENNEK